MWVILLDHSSSMGQPFEASGGALEGPVRSMVADVKLDAAKKSVLLQLQRLPRDTEVALLGFTTEVRLIYQSRAGEKEGFEQALGKVSAGGGTDIAAAIDALVDFAQEKRAIPRALLITDGQSDLDKAKIAARRASDGRIAIDIFLIDPTEKGLEMASAITRITNGQLDKVTSEERLLEGTSEAASEYAQAMARATELIDAEERESQQITAQRQKTEEVVFTAGYPSSIEPKKRYSLTVLVHLASLRDRVRRTFEERETSLGTPLESSTAGAAFALVRGQLITVRPSIGDIFTNPPQQEIVWEDDIHRLDFQMRYAGQSAGVAICSGFIDVFVGGLLLSQIPVSILVATELATPTAIIESVDAFSRVFASYARPDAAVVRACKEAYRVLGVHLFVDTDDLLSGELWQKRIKMEIAKSQLFQLYWSRAAAASTNVAEECALAKAVAGNKLYNFIRPLYWEAKCPALPEDFRQLNFARLDISKLPVVPEAAQEEKKPAVPVAKRLSITFPVLALDTASSPQTRRAIQEAMSDVIPFLESLTDLRYYPPPTLLVDEYTVKAVRQQLAVDPPEAKDVSSGDVEWALDVLRSMALAFHVGSLHRADDQYLNEDEERHFYGLTSDTEYLHYHHVKAQSEGGFVNVVAQYLKGADLFAADPQAPLEFKKELEKALTDGLAFLDLTWRLRDIFGVAESDDLERMRKMLGGDPREQLKDSRDPASRQALQRMLPSFRSQEFLGIVAKYSSDFFGLFGHGWASDLCRTRSFAEYARCFLELLLKYTAAAQGKRGDVPVRIGFSVSGDSLDQLRHFCPGIHFDQTAVKDLLGDPKPGEYSWMISLKDYRNVLLKVRQVVLEAIGTATKGHVTARYYVRTVPTFGIFASAAATEVVGRLTALAAKMNWPAGTAFPETPKVLVCANAFERYKSDLSKMDLPNKEADRLARWFLESTLVHEHMHAILETGLSKKGKSSAALDDWNGWVKGFVLNESLAAWVQLHYFRNNPPVFGDIQEYIYSGEYPHWPYRGAEEIEKVHERDGLAGVKKLIRLLRDDPELAQMKFDEMFGAEKASTAA